MSSTDSHDKSPPPKRVQDVRFPYTGPRPPTKKRVPSKAHPLKLPVPIWDRLEVARRKHGVEIPRNTWVALAVAEKLDRLDAEEAKKKD